MRKIIGQMKGQEKVRGEERRSREERKEEV